MRFQKRDKVLITCVLAMAAVTALVSGKMRRHSGGDTLRISIAGRVYGEYSLLENQTITIDEEQGYNQVVIENGMAYMSEADCPDRYCMDYMPVSERNEVIVCLPHKLVVEVVGGSGAGQPDAIVH